MVTNYYYIEDETGKRVQPFNGSAVNARFGLQHTCGFLTNKRMAQRLHRLLTDLHPDKQIDLKILTITKRK